MDNLELAKHLRAAETGVDHLDRSAAQLAELLERSEEIKNLSTDASVQFRSYPRGVQLKILEKGLDAADEKTLEHISKVGELLDRFAEELERRGQNHDLSKLIGPERDEFRKVANEFGPTKYGTPEYEEMRALLSEALDHHYRSNTHHPEHYVNGVRGMCLLDLVEMFFDWVAATSRHEDDDILDSLDINQERFALSDDLISLFRNTAYRMGLVEENPLPEGT